jgi:glucose-6-phosphate 1-dehydrogenase
LTPSCPADQIDVEQVSMDFTYSKAFGNALAEAYERLLLDAMLGDSTLFIRRDETELAWDRVTNVLEGLAGAGRCAAQAQQATAIAAI